jgi:hypothetical protein
MFQNKPSVSPLPTENLANILNPTQAQPLPRELVNLKNKKKGLGYNRFVVCLCWR